MNLFAIFATLLILVVTAFVLPPLWLGRPAAKTAPVTGRKEANLSIFRDQLAELEREKAQGTLAEADFEQAHSELQRRLLEEIEPGSEAIAATHGPSRKVAIALLFLIPLLALLGYVTLGNPKALDPAQAVAQAQPTAEQINDMVARLAAKLKENPDNQQGWLMLARSYQSLGRYGEAAEAYGKVETVINDDPELLANYAETLALANGRVLSGKPRQLVERALQIDPAHGHSLFLAGAAAMEAGENKKGITYWEKLLPQVEPGSDIEQMLVDGIEKMKKGNKG